MGLLLIIGGVTVGLGTVDLRSLGSTSINHVVLAQAAQVASEQTNAVQLVGKYSGAVKLNVTLGGVYSDTLATPPAPALGTPTPPDLGTIDLSLQLEQTANTLSGYVSLDRTLVYSAEHTLGSGASSLPIGPYVTGRFDGTTLTLHSERVSMVVSGRTVQRQFRLTGKAADDDGSQIDGEYRETLWGYASVPLTVIGSFHLQRPIFASNAATATNHPPITLADHANTTAGNAVTIHVLANDSDPNQDPLTITSVSKPQFGTATINGATVIYTPQSNFVGSDTFSYVVSDGQGGSAVGSVTVTVAGTGQSAGNAVYLPLIQR